MFLLTEMLGGGSVFLFWNLLRVSADGLAVFLDTGIDILADKLPKSAEL